MNDEKIFALFVKGEGAMLGVLVKKYQDPLYKYLVRYTNNTTLAEEILQETFIKVYEHSDKYDLQKPFRPWLYKVALNTARDKLRQKKLDWQSLADKEEPMAVNSPVRDLQSREIGEMIRKAVAELAPNQRQVFILRQYEKMSYADISTAVERPLNTVKSDMRRALQSLRELLASLTDIAMEGKYI
ncbi:RNA polymerase sigma factor [Candidatus Uabimicrobium amorphum]|uniref:RNA polymerase sigma factor n=1 Tax=Uabimicrobium amorphum TaxID=2596890 RepID=A0A5S9IV91_UABAM|nr:sigma-70 family RNA polymerase sigma factor [Candidatus Uabimicrobium amorphum]BBM88216.1 RNA polymerase sigma factor [Candidatus Uabimicrobium amorphum]